MSAKSAKIHLVGKYVQQDSLKSITNHVLKFRLMLQLAAYKQFLQQTIKNKRVKIQAEDV